MLFNTLMWWCSFLYYHLFNNSEGELIQREDVDIVQRDRHARFDVVYQWNYLNYTWESTEQYNEAIQSGKYVPGNSSPTGMKFYRNRMFLSVPRYRRGVPATLLYLDMSSGIYYENPLLTPYPSWESNDDNNCKNFQSVQSMEIDTRGIMWVIDGVRINNYTRCPPKLVLLDLNDGGRLVHYYVFPGKVARQDGGFLNDIVVDETDGEFAYISENSEMDPGIIVYSRRKNRSWKLRDVSMHPEAHAVNFLVDNIIFDAPVPVDGIALSPCRSNGEKTLYYCAISSYTVYSVPTRVIKNEAMSKTGLWRRSIRPEGQKRAQSDGIIIDEQGNMYLTMLPLYGVAVWNIGQPFSTMSMVDANRETMVWPDGFGFDQAGFLYLISNKNFNYVDLRRKPVVTNDMPFRILRIFTGTRSYLYG